MHCAFNDIVLRDAGSSASALLGRFRALGYEPLPRWADRATTMDGTVAELLLGPERA